MQQPNNDTSPNTPTTRPVEERRDSTENNPQSDPNEEHFRSFMQICFGNTQQQTTTPDPNFNKTHAILTKESYDEHLRIVRYWNLPSGHVDEKNGKHVSMHDFRRSVSRHWYHHVKFFRIQHQENGTEVLERRDEKSATWKIVLNTENVFDAIKECHGTDSHLGIKRTKEEMNKRFWNVAVHLCRIFIHTCPTCKQSTIKANTPKATKRATATEEYSEKFLCTIIDYSQKQQSDWNGNSMSYVLVLYDKPAEWIILKAIPTLEVSAVECEILQIICTRGHPRIHGPDLMASINPML
jgi:hypothetical protein